MEPWCVPTRGQGTVLVLWRETRLNISCNSTQTWWLKTGRDWSWLLVKVFPWSSCVKHTITFLSASHCARLYSTVHVTVLYTGSSLVFPIRVSLLIGCWSGFTGKITLTLPPQLLLPTTTNLLRDSEKSEDQPGSERWTGSQTRQPVTRALG